MTEESRLERFQERYASGQVPWDDDLPPPELISLAGELKPGRALDLGCGYGRSSIYLARHSWQVDGIDFVAAAVAEAERRARQAGVAGSARFHVSPVSDLSFLEGGYNLALDIGCMHSMSLPDLQAYHHELLRLLDEGAIYLLFAHLHDAQTGEAEEQRWVEDATVRGLFATGFELEDVTYGTTQVQDNPPWPSAWYRFRRRGKITA